MNFEDEMGLKIKIDTFDEIGEFLTKAKVQALKIAARQSINRAVSKARTETNKSIRQYRKFQASDLNKNFLKENKFRGGNSAPLDSIKASLEVSGRKPSLIRFVQGSKEPTPQKGIPIKARKKVKVQISPGRRITLKRAFIAHAKNATQVFVRKGDKLYKQAISSLAKLVQKPEILNPMVNSTNETFKKEMKKNYEYQLNKVKK